jgi:hypothetical protein
VHVDIISYTHEKYLTIKIEDATAKAVLDKRAGNFLLLQKAVVHSSDKNCENLNLTFIPVCSNVLFIKRVLVLM